MKQRALLCMCLRTKPTPMLGKFEREQAGPEMCRCDRQTFPRKPYHAASPEPTSELAELGERIVCRKLTSKMPCFLLNCTPSKFQKARWLFPQVTMQFLSKGENSTAITGSVELCREKRKE